MLLAVPPYLDKSHIHVYIDGLETDAFTWVNAQAVSTIAAANRLVRVIRRTSQDARLTAYLNGQPLPGDVLEVDSRQAFYMAQEAIDLALLAGSGNGGTGSGTPGVELTTAGIKALLLGQITPSLLETSLREEIGLINAPGSTLGSPAWYAAQEGLARAQALVAEAQARADALLQEATARGAAITHVTDLVQTEATSRAQQVTQLTSSINGSLAAIQQIDAVQSDQTAALAGQVTTLQTQFQSEKGVTEAKIQTVRDTVSTVNSALSQRIDTVQAQLGSSENLFPGPGFDAASPHGWPAAQLIAASTTGVPSGAPGTRVLKITTAALAGTEQAPCEPGTSLDVVFWSAAQGSARSVSLDLLFVDGAGAAIGAPQTAATATGVGTTWVRTAGRVVVPAGAIKCTVTLRQSPTGDLYIGAPTIEKRPEAFAAVEQAIGAVATRTAGVEANYTLKVQARLDGKNAIAGIGLNATASNSGPTQSQMVFLADQFTFVPSQADINVVPQPLLVMGLVNGVNTLVVPPSRYGDQLIEARMIVEGGIEARHMKITGGYGQALNMDPQLQDKSAWLGAGLTFVTVSDGVAGTYAVQMTDQSVIQSRPFQTAAGKQYRVSVSMRPVSGSGRMYLRLHFFNAAGTRIQFAIGNIETGVAYENYALPSGWNRFVAQGTAPPGAVTAHITVDSNYQLTGVNQIQDFRVEEMLDWSLIVQGGIRADRIDTRGLTIKDAAGNILLGAGTGVPWNYVKGPTEAGNMIVKPTFGDGQMGLWSGAGVGPTSGTGWNLSLIVNARDTYEVGTYTATSNERLYFEADLASRSAYWVRFGCTPLDKNGGVIAYAAILGCPPGGGFIRLKGFYDLPAGTVGFRPWIQVDRYDGLADGTNYAANLYIGRQEKGATFGATFGANVFGQITSATASTYIANAAISSAQVGQLTAANLTVTALSNTINGNASNGERVVVEANVIKVFDSSNLVRVKLGNLLA